MRLFFTKMYGLGNDYIYMDGFDSRMSKPAAWSSEQKGRLAVVMSRRHTGIGADGLIFIQPSEEAAFRMEMYNADGSLDDGGQLLKNLYKKMFRENPGGVRIDHIVGLIDPWVYKQGKKPKIEQGAGRLYSSPEHPELSKYAIARMEDLDTELTAD